MGNARNVRFSLADPVNWAGRTVQVQVTVNAIQVDHQAIVDAFVEKRTNARGPGHPRRIMKVMRVPSTAYNNKEWMRGLEEDAPQVEVRNGNAINCGPESRNAHFQCAG